MSVTRILLSKSWYGLRRLQALLE